MQEPSNKDKAIGYLVGALLFFFIFGLEPLIGYYYQYTSEGKEWVCAETLCFRRGTPRTYVSAGREAKVYFCSDNAAFETPATNALVGPGCFTLGSIVVTSVALIYAIRLVREAYQ